VAQRRIRRSRGADRSSCGRIGLALAQQIAEAHGGEATLVSRDDGRGARAVVRLPMRD
jgi:signal transduction histidine kinase